MTEEIKPTKVFYYCHETTWQSTRRDLVTFAMFVAMIGLGVFCNSPAMQWTGAVIFFLSLFAKAQNSMRKMTPDEIRADLDRIERDRQREI